MNERSVYLDTSSIVKRYVSEKGSSLADLAFERAEAGAARLVTSLWNVGEVLGVLDRYRSRKLFNDEVFLKTLGNFLAEAQKMIRLGSMQIVPLTLDTLVETCAVILNHHVYQADALQIATCKTTGSRLFLTADRGLLKIARAEKVEALNIETDETQIRAQLQQT